LRKTELVGENLGEIQRARMSLEGLLEVGALLTPILKNDDEQKSVGYQNEQKRW